MKTKLSMLFGMLLIASIVLTACGGGAAPTQAPAATQAPASTQAPAATEAPATQAPAATQAPSGEAKTITIWHQWSGDYQTAIAQVFKDYEASHPGVKIDLSKPDDVQAALKVAIPA